MYVNIKIQVSSHLLFAMSALSAWGCSAILSQTQYQPAMVLFVSLTQDMLRPRWNLSHQGSTGNSTKPDASGIPCLLCCRYLSAYFPLIRPFKIKETDNQNALGYLHVCNQLRAAQSSVYIIEVLKTKYVTNTWSDNSFSQEAEKLENNIMQTKAKGHM